MPLCAKWKQRPMSEVELIAIDGVGKAKLENMVMPCKCHYRVQKTK
jgi:hypothetical protein